jgi:hypothetical protein
MKRKLLTIAVTALLAGMAGYTADVLAAKGSPGPPPGTGGGGGGGETTLGNNLSLPTLFVPSTGAPGAPSLRIACTESPKQPGWDGAEATFLYDGSYYWVQKTAATWSATCGNSPPGLDVAADWGDNLTGDGRLKAGRPIRVEMRLIENGTLGAANRGYEVIKLTPDVADRDATYGTKGDELAQPYTVFDSGAELTIEKCANTDCSALLPIYSGEPGAEINSTGAVVYGYNWGIQATGAAANGVYKLTFTPKNVNIKTVVDTKANLCAGGAENCTYVYVTVGTSGGGKPPGKGGGE